MARRTAVLVGGGHSHVQVLRAHGMRPLDADLVVVLDQPVAVYSGMVPAFVAGQVPLHDLQIDVRALARRVGARVVSAAATGIDPQRRQVRLKGRPPISYDLCSVNVGSTVAGLSRPGVAANTVPTRPIADGIARLEARLKALAGQRVRLVVVGAGAAGVELACCATVRLRALGSEVDTILLDRGEWPVAERGPRVGARVAEEVERRGVRFLSRAEVIEAKPDRVVLSNGQELPADLVLWVAGARGPEWIGQSGLPVDERGFLRVADTLRVAPDLFAAGDCVVPESWPTIPKAGVYAVRQGPVLLENLRRQLAGRPLRPFRPQSDYLMLLNFGDGTALGAKWGRIAVGEWLWRWKDRIDCRFMKKFQVLEATDRPAEGFGHAMGSETEMVCGGCAAKVAGGPLRQALARLPGVEPDPSVVLGLDEADDVAAIRQGEGLLVASVDSFTAFTPDPWLVGRVAAVNACSDLFAKGATPHHAMALVTIPAEADPEETLFQVLSGIRAALDPEGIRLVGGHTTVGMELAVGLSVWGATDQALWTQRGLRPGDALVLSRALGTGVLWNADMKGRARGDWIEEATAGMVRGNGGASRAARGFSIRAATDITGFGLAGHLASLMRASQVSAEIRLEALPALPGALSLLAQGERSTFHVQNREIARGIAGPIRGAPGELLFDPQTAGGLLFGVGADEAEALVQALRAAGETGARIIGEVRAPRADGALFEVC